MRGKINFFWKIVFACFLMVLTFGVFDISADAATFSIGGKSYNTDDADKVNIEKTAYYFEDGTLYLEYPNRVLPSEIDKREDVKRVYCNKNDRSDFTYAFAWYDKAEEICFGKDFDTSIVTDMTKMFWWDGELKKVNVSQLDTTNVKSMNSMFHGCTSLEKLDLSNFKTSNVIDMGDMFYNCVSLSELDVSGFDTANVTSMEGMFINCEKMKTLNLSGFVTSKVENMSSMFSGCENLEKLDVSKFDTHSVTDMSNMFTRLGMSDIDLSSFNTSKVTNMSGMFMKSKLTKLDISHFDTSKVTTMFNLVCRCEYLKELNMSNIVVGKATDVGVMFNWSDKIEKIILKNASIAKSIELPDVYYDETGEKHSSIPIGKLNLVLTSSRPPKQSISKFAIKLSKDAYTYDGKAKKPTVSVKGLKLNKDFKVTYSNNTKIGKAKVVIKGIGNYKGSVTKYYTINPRGTSLSKVTCSKKTITVKWKKGDSQVTGYEIQYGTEKKTFTNENSKIVNVKKNATTSAKIKKGLKAKKTYYVRIRTYKTVGGKKYYSGWSTVKKIKVK